MEELKKGGGGGGGGRGEGKCYISNGLMTGEMTENILAGFRKAFMKFPHPPPPPPPFPPTWESGKAEHNHMYEF